MRVNIGDLKHFVTFQTLNTTEDSAGFETKTWTDTKQAYAKIFNQTTTKMVENDKRIFEKNLLFVVRYQDITKDMRLFYNGKAYEIKNIEDDDFSKRFLTLTVKEVEA